MSTEPQAAAAADVKPIKKSKEQKEQEKKDKAAAMLASQTRAYVPIDFGGLNQPDGTYGDLLLIQSTYQDARTWLTLDASLDAGSPHVNREVWLRARLFNLRSKGKFAFLIMRRGFYSLQCIMNEGECGVTREAIKWVGKVPHESILDVCGTLLLTQQANKTSYPQLEIKVSQCYLVSTAATTLPFQMSDAATPMAATTLYSETSGGDSKQQADDAVITVGQDLRLDNRWLDVRTPANHAIFRIQSRVCQYFRQYFLDRDFIEIHTPKLTPGVSEGGAAVFRLKYFETDACLAQSPQLYKQMAICSDLFRVFEIGPVFRAEQSNTHRHMCEFTGMDFEMEIKQHYHEVLEVLSSLFVYIFDRLNAECQRELAAVNAQYPFAPLQYRRDKFVIPFSQAIQMLRDAGETIGDEEDFSTPQEKLLGREMKRLHQVDFYIVDQYPLTARPFYTMPNRDNPRFTNSYDVFVRGEEITSGAQRIHDVPLLTERAKQCGIPDSGIKDYVESFKYGAWPHGGAGIGLERVVMLFLGLDNIRKSALFPRTPNRLTP